MKREYSHGGSLGKSLVLLLRSLLFAVGFAAIWTGVALIGIKTGVVLVVCGSAVCAICVFANIIVPISRMK